MNNMTTNNNNRIPELRFPGFTGDWEERRLVDSFEERIEKDRGDLPLLSLGEEGLTLQSETQRKDNSNSDKSKYLRVATGDVAYNTMRMWQGRCVYCNIEGIVSPAYTVCKPKDGIDPLFHYYLFKTAQMINIFHQNSQGLVNDTLNLKYEAFSKIKYLLPTLAEQQKIAECLSSLDEEIAAEAQKADALKDHKKGLMQQLFPAISNEQLAMSNCVPKLRFSGFTGSWEVKKLGEVANLSKGKGIAKSDIDIHGQTPCIRYGELYTRYGEQIKTVFSRTNIPSQDLVLGKVNDVIIPSSGETHEDIATASCILVPGVAIGGDINILRTPLNGLFLSYYLNSAKKHEIAHIAQGDAVVHLYGTQLSKLSICFPPTLAEQQKIADCLSELDEMISAQQQKVEALKEHKKGLMQKLFPKM